MTPPWFTRFLPQREAALSVLRRFAAEEGESADSVTERYDGRRTVMFVGIARDGREFGIGYEWTPEQAHRYAPRQRQPVFRGSARWPADVFVPLRAIRRG